MLKLIKHDFISTGRIIGIVYAIVAFLSAFILITKKGENSMVSSIGAVILVLATMVLFVVVAVVLMIDFHKSLYGDRGYLTFTLPVKSWKVLLSKLIVSGAWLLVALAAILGTGVLFVTTVDSEYGEMIDIVETFADINVASYVILMFTKVVILFIEFCSIAILAFFANTCSNVWKFQKHPVIFTIIFAVAALFVVAKINDFANDFFAFGVFFVDEKIKFAFTNTSYMNLSNEMIPRIDLGGPFIIILEGVASFFATNYLMSKKINIK